MKYLQVKLDDNIHDKFKQKTYETKSDMSALVRLWINNYLKENLEE